MDLLYDEEKKGKKKNFKNKSKIKWKTKQKQSKLELEEFFLNALGNSVAKYCPLGNIPLFSAISELYCELFHTWNIRYTVKPF